MNEVSPPGVKSTVEGFFVSKSGETELKGLFKNQTIDTARDP
jgi:hypothetical protein